MLLEPTRQELLEPREELIFMDMMVIREYCLQGTCCIDIILMRLLGSDSIVYAPFFKADFSILI